MMVKLRVRMYVILTLLYLAVGMGGMLLFWLLAPHEYFEFRFFVWIDLFFWLCGMTLNFLLDRDRRRRPARMINTYMFFRFGQFVLMVALLALGMTALHFPRAPFAISLFGNYLLYSALEIYMFSRYNKRVSHSK